MSMAINILTSHRNATKILLLNHIPITQYVCTQLNVVMLVILVMW